jgi:hypothetical protein
MPFMHPIPLAAKAIQKAYPWLGAAICEEATQAYAHAVYASESDSLTDLDIARIKWMIGTWLSETHQLAQDAIRSVMDTHLS